MRIGILSLALVVLLALTLVGCSKPAAPPTETTAAPPPEARPAPPTAEPPAKPASEAAEKAAAKPELGPKLEGEDDKPVVTTKSGLKYIVLEKGTGKQPKAGDTVVADYTGWLTDGKKFDSSKDRPGEGFSFTVGKGEVIPAWDEALLGMKEGERRKLIVPPALGYGDAGMPPVIPEKATLIFEVKLVKIK